MAHEYIGGMYPWDITMESMTFFYYIHLDLSVGANYGLPTCCLHCIQLKPVYSYIDCLHGWRLCQIL